jgi:hypothetical protein
MTRLNDLIKQSAGLDQPKDAPLALENWNAGSSPPASPAISAPANLADDGYADEYDQGDFDLDLGATPDLARTPKIHEVLSSSSMSRSESDDESTPARLVQQLRKKTRGLLPASFKFFTETPATALNRQPRPSHASDGTTSKTRGKAVRKTRTGQPLPQRTAWQIAVSDQSSSDDAPIMTDPLSVPRGSVRSSVAGVHAPSTPNGQSTGTLPIFIDDDSDMEHEEQINRMVDRGTPRPRGPGIGQAKRKRQTTLHDNFARPRSRPERLYDDMQRLSHSARKPRPHRRTRLDTPPPLFISDLLDQFPVRAQVPSDLRLASRLIRQRGADVGAQLSRKQFSFYDPSAKQPSESVDAENVPEQVLRQWARGKLPVEGVRAKQYQKERRRNQEHRTTQQHLHQQPSEKIASRQKRKKASTVRSGGFYLEDDDTLSQDEDGLPNDLKKQRSVVANPTKVQQAPFFTSRTFQTTLEQETGRVALPAPKAAQQRSAKAPAYLRNLVELSNLFEEDDFQTKVSHWQVTAPEEEVLLKLPKAPGAVESAPQRKARRKLEAKRRRPIQQSLLPFLTEIDEQAPAQDNATLFAATTFLTDVSLGCEPLHPDCSFLADTVAGADIGAVLEHGAFVSLCFYKHARYDLEHLPQLINAFFPAVEHTIRTGKALSRDDYDVFRFLANNFDARTKNDIFGRTNELRQLAALHLDLHIRCWLSTFSLLFCFQNAQVAHEWTQFSLLLENCLAFLLSSTLEPLETLLRRQRNQSIRANGLSATNGSILECWVVLYHLAQFAAQLEPTFLSFWPRINRRLVLQDCANDALAERAWKTLMLLSNVTSFDMRGKATVPCENWDCVLALLGKILVDYDQHAASPTAESHDAYILLSFRRCHRLATVFKWPNTGKLLQGKVGGVLHDFFWRQLSLANLRHEQNLYDAFPPFLHHLDAFAACLVYEHGDMAGTFSTFLKVLCLSLLQLHEALPPGNRRAISHLTSIVDKFQTFGPMNAQAEADLSVAQLGQMRNRFAVEIAIYWAAGQYKHQDISRLLETSMAHMPGSHLELRRVNIQAWGIVIRLQLSRGEHDRLQASIDWLKYIFSTTVDDIKRFSHELGQPQSTGRAGALQENIKRCHRIVSECLAAYNAVMLLPATLNTAPRLHQFWLMDILKCVLQNQGSFHRQKSSSQSTLSLLQQTLDLTRSLLEAAAVSLCNDEESQDFGFDFSQDEEGNALIDVRTLVRQDVRDTAQLVHRFLSDVFSSAWRYERDASGEYIPKELPITALLLQRCKIGIEALYRCAHLLRTSEDMPWSELFDQQGPVSWWRLPESPVKSRVLPFYLALLLRRETSFYEEMSDYIIAVWIGSMANPDIRASLATLTNELLKFNDEFVNVGEMTAELLDQYRLSYIDSSLRTLVVQKKVDLARSCIASLGDIIKDYLQSIKDAEDKAFYVSFIHAILRVIISRCASCIAIEDIESITWLTDASNMEQPVGSFATQRLQSLAYIDFPDNPDVAAFKIASLCEAGLLKTPGPISLLPQALGSTDGQPWNHELAALRRFLVTGVYQAFAQLAADLPQATLYAAALSQSLQQTYKILVTECMQQDGAIHLQIVHEVCQLAFDLQRSASLTILLVHLLEQFIDSCTDAIREFCIGIKEARKAFQPPDAVIIALKQHLESCWSFDGQEVLHKADGVRLRIIEEALFTQSESVLLEAVCQLEEACDARQLPPVDTCIPGVTLDAI